MDTHNVVKEQDSIISVCTSGYGTLKNSDTSEKEPPSLTSLNEAEGDSKTATSEHTSDAKQHDSLTSIGESSDYDSFKYKADDVDSSEVFAEDSFRKCFGKTEGVREYENEVPLVRSWRASAESIIGEYIKFRLIYCRFYRKKYISLLLIITYIYQKKLT